MKIKNLNLNLNLRKRQNFFGLSYDRKNSELKKIFMKSFFYVNLFLNSYGLEISQIELKEYSRNILDGVTDEDISNSKKNQQYNQFKNKIFVRKLTGEAFLTSEQILNFVQSLKDKINLSKQKYNTFLVVIRKICRDIKFPGKSKLTTFEKKKSSFFRIKSNTLGFYVDVKEKITYVLNKIFTNNRDVIRNNLFNVHLSGDGMVISKTHHNVLNFTFKVLDECNDSESGIYKLGIFEVNKESYDNLKLALKEIVDQLSKLKQIEIDKKIFNIEWTQGGDLKWILNMSGLSAANSNNPCPWCLWSITDGINALKKFTSICGRSLQDATKNLTTNGYKNIPILQFIEFKKSIVDSLHMCLRITDRLFEILIDKIDQNDTKGIFFDKKKLSDLSKRVLLNKLIRFCEDECKVYNPFYFDSKENKIKLRSINQTERLNILMSIKKNSLMNLFGDDDSFKKINFVLVEFYILFMRAKKDYRLRNFDKEKYKEDLNKWVNKYLGVTKGADKLTPYIHIFVNHIPEFIEEHKDLNLFSTQALEKLNSLTKTQYHLQTNRQLKRSSYLKQLLEKANRMEFDHLNGTVAELFSKLNNQKIIYVANPASKRTSVEIPKPTNDYTFCECPGKCSTLRCPCLTARQLCNINCHYSRRSINCKNYTKKRLRDSD